MIPKFLKRAEIVITLYHYNIMFKKKCKEIKLALKNLMKCFPV